MLKADLGKGCQQQSRASAKFKEETPCVLCLCYWSVLPRGVSQSVGTGQPRWPVLWNLQSTPSQVEEWDFLTAREKKPKIINLLKHGLPFTWLSAPWLHKWNRDFCYFLLLKKTICTVTNLLKPVGILPYKPLCFPLPFLCKSLLAKMFLAMTLSKRVMNWLLTQGANFP